MLLALRLALSRWLSRAAVAPAEDDRSAEGSPADRVEALWREARDASSPYRREALFVEVANAAVELHGPEVLRFCERHLADRADAEDVAQRTFVELWRLLPRFEGRSSLRTFTFGIALNLCRRAARTDQRASSRLEVHEGSIREEVHPERLPEIEQREHEREQRGRLDILRRTLAVMDERDAWLLRARLVDELSYAEILPRYQRRFGTHIGTLEGLRTAFFHAKRELERRLRGQV